ncbi:MAG: ankyrin repeat domain-containing protein [Smithellaceae bacterium]|nr:ankyrin repeat domain-containing protein [Syntrophaceae bacterium]MDD4241150.1 ankyrin repeat domain-containing protein [Smithellaceae bacterium]NLX52237.1 hypothetical protein [Deltaproteobacteria bacterium]
MKKKMLLVNGIVFVLLLAVASVAAASDRLLDDFFRDTRPEVEKISADPGRMEKFILSQKDANTRFAGGKTLLHYAAFRNDAGNVALLLQKGATVNAADADGRTPLHEAMSYFAFEAVSLLVENGADVNRADKEGRSPLASIVYWDDAAKAVPVVKLFIRKGFDLQNPRSAALLNDALARGKKDAALILLQNGVRTDDKALHEAARRGYEDIVSALLAAGADPQRVTFQAVCESGAMGIVRLLAQKGLRPSAADVDFCLYNGHREAAVYLNRLLSDEKKETVDLKRRCRLTPDPGQCKANFRRAYYDPKTNTCREFSYGGCGGEDPFESLAACKSVCEEQTTVQKACLAATQTAIALEIRRYAGWIDLRKSGQVAAGDLPALEATLARLKEDLQKYQAMKPEDYALPPQREMTAWVQSQAADNAILYIDRMSRSGPWYHLAGIVGGDYGLLQPNVRKSVVFYSVYPRRYGSMESAYVCIASVE